MYAVASITKTFTGTAIMQLRDEGRLHLDDPAVAHIPELRAMESPFGPVETVTLRRMLSHESGLMGEPNGTDWTLPTYEASAEKNLSRASSIGTKIPPSIQPKYSNLAYQLLGEVVSRVSGVPYEEYVRCSILEPLGMTQTGFLPLTEELASRRATGYAARSFSDHLTSASKLPPCGAEGGLWSSVEDLAKWLCFQFRVEEHVSESDGRVLAGTSLKEMHKARYLSDEEWTQAWGIAWYAVRRENLVWVQHSGGLHGFTSNICFEPRRKVGAVVLLNGVGDAATLAMDLATIARDAIGQAVPVLKPATAPPDEFAPLLGIYANPEFGNYIRLEWRDGKLTFVDPDDATWRPCLLPTADRDVFVVDLGVRESGESAVFRRSSEGRIADVLLAATTWVRFDSCG
jgi:CubicO group peptidase (beta-lactamase class C family)